MKSQYIHSHQLRSNINFPEVKDRLCIAAQVHYSTHLKKASEKNWDRAISMELLAADRGLAYE